MWTVTTRRPRASGRRTPRRGSRTGCRGSAKTRQGMPEWLVDGKSFDSIGFNMVRPDGTKAPGNMRALPLFEQMHAGSYDVTARVAWLDEHGISRQIMYPNTGGFSSQMFFTKIADEELRNVCIRTYNDAAAACRKRAVVAWSRCRRSRGGTSRRPSGAHVLGGGAGSHGRSHHVQRAGGARPALPEPARVDPVPVDLRGPRRAAQLPHRPARRRGAQAVGRAGRGCRDQAGDRPRHASGRVHSQLVLQQLVADLEPHLQRRPADGIPD